MAIPVRPLSYLFTAAINNGFALAFAPLMNLWETESDIIYAENPANGTVTLTSFARSVTRIGYSCEYCSIRCRHTGTGCS